MKKQIETLKAKHPNYKIVTLEQFEEISAGIILLEPGFDAATRLNKRIKNNSSNPVWVDTDNGKVVSRNRHFVCTREKQHYIVS